MKNKFLAVLELCRISNLPTVISNCFAGILVAEGISESALIPILIGASLVYSGGMVMNDAVDFRYDKKFKKSRPIVSSKISLFSSWQLAVLFLVSGAVFLVIGSTSYFWVALLIISIIFYNLFHKKFGITIYVMGFCRSLLYFIAGYTLPLSSSIILWGLALGLYTAGITLVARGEDKDQKVKMIGIILLTTPVFLSIYFSLSNLNLISPIILSSLALIVLILYSLRIINSEKPGKIGKAVSLLIAGMCVVDSMAVSSVLGYEGLFFIFGVPIVLIFQRKIAGT